MHLPSGGAQPSRFNAQQWHEACTTSSHVCARGPSGQLQWGHEGHAKGSASAPGCHDAPAPSGPPCRCLSMLAPQCSQCVHVACNHGLQIVGLQLLPHYTTAVRCSQLQNLHLVHIDVTCGRNDSDQSTSRTGLPQPPRQHFKAFLLLQQPHNCFQCESAFSTCIARTLPSMLHWTEYCTAT